MSLSNHFKVRKIFDNRHYQKNIETMKKHFLPLLFLFTAFFVQSFLQAQSRIWTLENCIEYALQNNIQIKQSELNIEASGVSLLESKLSLLPSLNSSAGYSYNWGRYLDQALNFYVDRETRQGNLGLNANLVLFAGLQKQNVIKKQKIEFQSSKYATDKMKDDISLMLTQAYLSILFNRELLKVAREQVVISKEQIARTEKLVAAGTLARGSLLEIQAQNASEELAVINYENSLDLAYLDLLQILDLPYDTDFEIDVPVIEIEITGELPTLATVYTLASERLPQIKKAELDVESAYKDVAIAKGRLSPTLSLVSGWGTNYSSNFPDLDTTSANFGEVMAFGDQVRNNQSRYLGLNLSIPIFNGYQASSNVSLAKISATNAEYNYQLTLNTLRKSIEQAYSDARGAYKSYVATRQSLTSFQESFRYTEQKFNVGLSNSLDYNIAKTQLASVESELIRARYDYIFKQKILEFYMGLPLTLSR
ncbi:TolC family protein [Candidatus Falkowbacteria bacterium]|jgi:outer membrane protein|nr:TolC family protein [Candidatus Falkowbacteria bacterium]